jgi:glucose/mannose transport system permease protein
VTAATAARTRPSAWLPRLALAPSFAAVLVCVYGFILFSVYLSFTSSKMLPVYEWLGFANYVTLFKLPAWHTALVNLAIFGVLYIGLCIVIGAALAIALDQRIRAEGVLRAVYLYPMALSFIVTGTAWKWLLDPGVGLEQVMHVLGWQSFVFGWIKDRDMAIYTVVIAGVWQTSGFVMALFLAGLRGISDEVMKAAQIDGARGFALYRHVVLPQLTPTLLSAIVLLTHMAIKSYDLVIALTGGGPGRATELPATFMYSYTFTRNQMAVGASSAVIMLCTVTAVMVPYLYSELRERRDAR